MRALTLAGKEDFEWTTLPEPAAPGPGQALVAIRAIGICGTDISGWRGRMPFITCPRILGHELGVEVLATGEDVAHLRAGDRCSVEPYLECGACHSCSRGKTNCCESLEVLGVHCDGGMRERMILPARKLHSCGGLHFEQLALVETLAIGCHAVDRAALEPEDDVLIVGAGPIGLSVLEFARMAAKRITVFELSAARREFVARHYPGTHVVDSLPDEPVAQVVFDATGSAVSMTRAFRHARFTGRVVYVGITPDPVPLDDPLLHRRELTLLASRNAVSADFPRILRLIQEGRIRTGPWITHRAPLEELPEKMREWTQPEAAVVKAVVAV
ncbi:MAG TPA: L-iditol 2-dehydrogenase [Verrucomicrobiales bacterium]|nr:L-iditol 2-dehydrogenase [Verrucomicrobiales bacterium]